MAANSTKVKLTLKITSFILRILMNVTFYIIVILLIIDFSKEAYTFTYRLYGPVVVDAAPGRDILFQINKGESTMDIAGKLELNGAIIDKYPFYLKVKLKNLMIMPGTYKINSSLTFDEILNIITDYSKSIVQEETPGDQKDSEDQTDGQKQSEGQQQNQQQKEQPAVPQKE